MPLLFRVYCQRSRLILKNTDGHIHISRRSAAEQLVLALIAPLAKLGRFQAATDFFQIDVLHLAYRVG